MRFPMGLTLLYLMQRFALKSQKSLKTNSSLLCLAAIQLRKKQILLLKAALMSKHKKEIQIVLAGSGPKEKKLKKWINRHMKENPAILRTYKHEEVNQILGCADLYVHTSLIEIEAISCLEALSCGLVPVISNSPRSATSRFALRPESSFNYCSARDLAKKIDWWIEHPEEKSQSLSPI